MELHSTSLEMTEREVAATLRTTFMSMPTASPARRKSQALTHSISTIPGSEEELQTFAEMDSPVSPTIDNQKRPRKRPRLADTPESGADAPESDIRRHQCSYPGCDKRYRKKNKLDEHVRSHTGERPYVCPVEGCGKAYMRSTHLIVHARSHIDSNSKPHRCTVDGCSATFSTRQHLIRHQSVHEQPLSFVCDWEGCDAAFTKRYQLRNHICTHTNKKPYPCTRHGCQSSFNSLHQLEKHESTVHNMEKRYFCGYEGCGAQFLKWSQLQYHNNHEHEIKCTICGNVFAKRYYLTQHIQATHMESESVECHWEGCEKKFASSKSLNVHVKTAHQNIKPHKCPHEDCVLAFSHQSLLRRHLETRHAPKLPKPDTTASGNISVLTGYKENANVKTRGYVCPIAGCGASYWREYDLKRHLASKNHEADINEHVPVVNNK